MKPAARVIPTGQVARPISAIVTRAPTSALEEPVADPPAVDDEASVLGIELSPQAARVGIKGAGSPHRAKAPYVAQEVLLPEHAMRVRSEGTQQREFLVREPDLAVA